MPSARKPPSLLLRLSITAVIVVLLALGLIGIAVDRAFRAAEEAALRDRLESAMFAVLAGLEVGTDGGLAWTGAPADSALTQPESGLYAGVWSESDAWFSPSTLGMEIPVARDLADRGAELFGEPGPEVPWYVYRRGLGWETADGAIVDLTVWTAEDPSRLRQELTAFRADLWMWLGLAAAVLLVAQTVLLLQPILILRRVAAEVEQIEAGRRGELTGRYPRELQPLTGNLNALLRTERANAEQYSQALADLAHSLKTPLAVLNSQVDAGNPPGPAELRELVAQMQGRIRDELDRAARSGRRTMLPEIAVAPIAARIVRSLNKLYPDTDFELDCVDALRANVAERDLAEVLGNLLDNAAKYGAARVHLALAPRNSGRRRTGLGIRVDDDGPGIDPERFAELLQRGVRGDEIAEGQGLGLSIVQRIAESYDGEVRAADSPLGGLRVEVELKPS